jgi:hypothetical protein
MKQAMKKHNEEESMMQHGPSFFFPKINRQKGPLDIVAYPNRIALQTGTITLRATKSNR